MSPEVCQALVNLRNNRDWEAVLAWLKAQRAQWNQVLIEATDPDKRAVAAGMTRALDGVLAGIESAPQKLLEYNQHA